jgi:hypothetical protein
VLEAPRWGGLLSAPAGPAAAQWSAPGSDREANRAQHPAPQQHQQLLQLQLPRPPPPQRQQQQPHVKEPRPHVKEQQYQQQPPPPLQHLQPPPLQHLQHVQQPPPPSPQQQPQQVPPAGPQHPALPVPTPGWTHPAARTKLGPGDGSGGPVRPFDVDTKSSGADEMPAEVTDEFSVTAQKTPMPQAQKDSPVHPVPPLTGKVPAPVPLNSHGLFVTANFRGEVPNERGRGAFAAALLSLLDQSGLGATHVQVVRCTTSANQDDPDGEQHFDRWSLNRLPGCTDMLLRFINNAFVDVMGLKPFMSWRSLARCLGDSRSYLSHRHWQCLELKGGGKMASTAHPWQSYRTKGGHFDSLAKDLLDWLKWCGAEATEGSGSGDAPEQTPKAMLLAKNRAKTMGARLPRCDSVNAVNCLLKVAWGTACKQTGPIPAGGKEKRSSAASAKRKGAGDEQSRPARPTKRGLLAAATVVAGTFAAVTFGRTYAALTRGGTAAFESSSEAAGSSEDIIASGFIEVGTVNAMEIGQVFRAISFQGSFVDPVIIGGMPSSTSAASRGNGAAPRIRSWSAEEKSFEMFLDVPRIDGRRCGGATSTAASHSSETVSWMMVESGAWQSTTSTPGGDGAFVEDAPVTRGAIEAGSGLYGLCSGGPLCTPANGCDTCGWTTGFEWRDVKFAIPHPDPVVLAQIQTYSGHDWVTSRLRLVSPGGFQVRQEEDGVHGYHMSEMLGWVVFSNGAGWFDVRSQRMLDYQAIRTGQTVTNNAHSIAFAGEFSRTPALFGSLQTTQGGDPAHLRYSAKGVTACTMFLEEELCSDQELVHDNPERAGVVAIEPGLAKLRPQAQPLSSSLRGLLEAGARSVRRTVEPNGLATVQFFQTTSAEFESPVVFLGPQQYDRSGDEQRAPRVRSVTTIPRGADCPRDDADEILANAGLSCDEGHALVGCSVHSDLHWSAPDLIPRYTFLPQLCPRTCNACGTTIVSFYIESPRGALHYRHGDHTNPHTCASMESYDSADTEPHVVSWLVVEAGTWAGGTRLLEETDAWSHGKMHAASGTLGICSGGPLCSLENGCDSCDLESGFKWVDVRFPDGIFSAQPLVLSQVQTFHGPNWVTTRHRTVSPTGFGMAMQGAGMTSGHMTEEIGYLAVPAGGGSLHGLGYDARITRTVVRLCPALRCAASPILLRDPLHRNSFRVLRAAQVSSTEHSIEWRRTFASRPSFFAQMQTYHDAVPGIVRYTRLGNSPRSAQSNGGATFLIEDASCGQAIVTGPERENGRQATCCAGVGPLPTTAPDRVPER